MSATPPVRRYGAAPESASSRPAGWPPAAGDRHGRTPLTHAASVCSNRTFASTAVARSPSTGLSLDASSSEGNTGLEAVRQNLRFAFDDALPGPTTLRPRRAQGRPPRDDARRGDLRETLLRYRAMRHSDSKTIYSAQNLPAPYPHGSAGEPPSSSPPVCVTPRPPAAALARAGDDQKIDEQPSSMTLDHHLLVDAPAHVSAVSEQLHHSSVRSRSGATKLRDGSIKKRLSRAVSNSQQLLVASGGQNAGTADAHFQDQASARFHASHTNF